MIDSVKHEFATLAASRFMWFLAGVFLAGHDVPSVVNSLRTFVGL